MMLLLHNAGSMLRKSLAFENWESLTIGLFRKNLALEFR